MTNWKPYKLGDLVTFQRGHDLTVSNIQAGKYPVGGSNGVIGYHNEFTTRGPSLTLGRSGNSIGVAHYYENDFWAHNTTLYAKEFKNSDPKFLYYLLKNLDFAGHNSGSAVPSLNRNFINPIQVIAPDLPTQQKIAEILSAVDDKIELNRRINQTLEQMEQTVFRQYFVDGIDADNLPEGWRVGKIKNVASISKASVNPGKFPDKHFFHYSLPAYDSAQLPTREVGASILSNKFVVKSNSILFSKLNPRFPRVWAIGEVDESKAICSTEFLVFEPISDNWYSFTYLQLSNEEIIKDLTNKASGTSGSHQRVRPDEILELEIIIPSEEKAREFEEKTRALLNKKIQNNNEAKNLRELRDTLLPKLMSGEIDVMQTQTAGQYEEILS